jgi:hypothetical protein
MDYTEEEKEPELTSRSGYEVRDVVRAFLQTLGEAGAMSSGKLLHYTADMISSGGLLLFERLCYDYAFDHIGIASPRIFYYLHIKFRDLREKAAKHELGVFCTLPDVQQATAEMVLILQGCPKKTKPKYPTIPPETHDNEGWLRSVLRTTDKAAVRRVYQRSSDQEQLLHAGNEMVFAIAEGATERALFWAKWLQEEDSLARKRYQSGLSTAERGPPALKSQAQKTATGYYLIAVLAELYKEFSQKGMVRLHQEFQTLLDLYRATNGWATQRRKNDILALLIQILVDMPRMKVPAAPALVQDPALLERMVQQAPTFYREVLYHPMPTKLLPQTVTGLKKKKAKEPTKEDKLQQQLALMDQMAMTFYKI